MTSDSSYSGYLNDESNSGSRKKTALLQKKGIMSDNTYYRMKGIIARKKSGSTIYWNQSSTSEDIDTTMTTSASNHDISSYSFQNQSESDATNNEYFINDLMLSKMNSMSSFSQRCDSDSSDSLVDKTAMRQIRRKKNRKRAKKKKRLRGESILHNGISSRNPNRLDDEKLSKLLKSPRSKKKALHFLSEHAPSLHDSIVARLDCAEDRITALDGIVHTGDDSASRNENTEFRTPEKQQGLQPNQDAVGYSSRSGTELDFDTTNTILPSLVKKGIVYCDLPRIERTLDEKLRKIDAMNKKQKMLSQLLERFALEISERNRTQKGMASLHKLRAIKKVALQASFLRCYGERKHQWDQSPGLSTPNTAKNEGAEKVKPAQFESEMTNTKVQHNPLIQSPVSPMSSFAEKSRLKNLLGKTKRSLSNSLKSPKNESLFESQLKGQRLKSDPMDEAVSIPKISPFNKIIFCRPKGDVNYQVLSPDSSLSNDISSDSDHFSSTVDSTTLNNDDEIHVESSDDSAWSEMSFQSDPNRFTVSSVASLLEKRNSGHNSQKYQKLRPLPIETNHSKTYNDSFDDIVLRNTPKPGSKNYSDIRGQGISPTGVMDIFSQQRKIEDVDNALAFADDDEGDHVFTDKDDSFILKSAEQMGIFFAYQPVFLSPSRFEI